MPSGYTVEYGGQFENQQRAIARLSIIVPIVILGVFLMLWMSFGSLRQAGVIMVSVPIALLGGIMGLIVMGEYLSVPASVGFIALFGVAVQNGIVLVTYFNDLRERGRSVDEAVQRRRFTAAAAGIDDRIVHGSWSVAASSRQRYGFRSAEAAGIGCRVWSDHVDCINPGRNSGCLRLGGK